MELQEYFRLFGREALLKELLDAAHVSEVRDPAGAYDDPYARLDELMVVIEELCPVWPARPLLPQPAQRYLL